VISHSKQELFCDVCHMPIEMINKPCSLCGSNEVTAQRPVSCRDFDQMTEDEIKEELKDVLPGEQYSLFV
jgi:predicted amidophosphoribosyltransferase